VAPENLVLTVPSSECLSASPFPPISADHSSPRISLFFVVVLCRHLSILSTRFAMREGFVRMPPSISLPSRFHLADFRVTSNVLFPLRHPGLSPPSLLFVPLTAFYSFHLYLRYSLLVITGNFSPPFSWRVSPPVYFRVENVPPQDSSVDYLLRIFCFLGSFSQGGCNESNAILLTIFHTKVCVSLQFLSSRRVFGPTRTNSPVTVCPLLCTTVTTICLSIHISSNSLVETVPLLFESELTPRLT